MTGIIFDIKRFAVHDGPGIRATVFFKGCSLKCAWCHNPESLEHVPTHVNKILKLNGRSYSKEEVIGYEISEEDLLSELLKEQIFMNESGGGVTFSGGEPLLQHRFLLKMLAKCNANGMHTTVDTSLFAPWKIIDEVARLCNLFLVDLKLMNDTEHQQYTGVSNKVILDNIEKLSAQGIKMRIRIPMIPDVNTAAENIEQCIAFLKSLPNAVEGVDLLPFHNTANEKYKRVGIENRFGHIRSMSKDDLKEYKTYFENAGFNVKIGG